MSNSVPLSCRATMQFQGEGFITALRHFANPEIPHPCSQKRAISMMRRSHLSLCLSCIECQNLRLPFDSMHRIASAFYVPGSFFAPYERFPK